MDGATYKKGMVMPKESNVLREGIDLPHQAPTWAAIRPSAQGHEEWMPMSMLEMLMSQMEPECHLLYKQNLRLFSHYEGHQK